MDRSGRRDSEQLDALLIDDDRSTLTRHQRSLSALGYHVIKVADPTMALNVAKQAVPRIIFMSLGQLGSGGASFLQALRAYDGTRHIPVGILSDHKDRWLERHGLRRIGREHW
jgi:CheY-like chemotaxis protein